MGTANFSVNDPEIANSRIMGDPTPFNEIIVASWLLSCGAPRAKPVAPD
jgi:hypothetical protein